MPRKDPQARQEYEKARYQVTAEEQRAYSRAWYARHKNEPDFQQRQARRKKLWLARMTPEQRYRNLKNQILRREYGISLTQFDAMKEAQGNRCAICGNFPRVNKQLSVDHDHATGKVRGLLCSVCNGFLGMIHDDWRKVMNYLEVSCGRA